MGLPQMRWVQPETMRSLRVIDRALAHPQGLVSTAAASSVVSWRCGATTIARAWLPPGRCVPGYDMQFELTVLLPRRDRSPRWTDTVELRPGHFAHHLGVYGRQDVDDEVLRWLQQACSHACRPGESRLPGRPLLRLVPGSLA